MKLKSFSMLIGFGCALYLNSADAQTIRTKVESCNNVEARLEVLGMDRSTGTFTFVLERQVAPNIWLSQQKQDGQSSTSRFNNLTYGTYRIKAINTAENSAAADKEKVHYSPSFDIKNCQDYEKMSGTVLQIAPNPSSGSGNIIISGFPKYEGKTQFIINSSLGEQVTAFFGSGDQASFSAETLPKGIYLIMARQNDHNVGWGKLIIE